MKTDTLPVVTLTHIPGTTRWITAHDVDWFGVFTIPKGFETDLASIPRPLWTFLPRDGVWLEAAVAHDYCYRMREEDQVLINSIFCMTREDADKLFLDSMEKYGVGLIARKVIYWGVRMFGGFYWNSHCKSLDQQKFSP